MVGCISIPKLNIKYTRNGKQRMSHRRKKTLKRQTCVLPENLETKKTINVLATEVWLANQQHQYHSMVRNAESQASASAFLNLNLMNLHFTKIPRGLLLSPGNQDLQDEQTENSVITPIWGAFLAQGQERSPVEQGHRARPSYLEG